MHLASAPIATHGPTRHVHPGRYAVMSLFFVSMLAATAVGCSADAPCEPAMMPARDSPPPSQPLLSSDINIGPGLVVVPRYPGSRVERVWPFPALNVSYGHLFATT